MRVHIELDDALVAEIDQRAGTRNRTDYIRRAITAALRDSARWELVESAAGSIEPSGHEWDEDPAAWVRSQRRADARRVG